MTIDQFIARMVAVFGPPNTPDPKMFFEELRRSVAGTAPDLLSRTCHHVVDTGHFWPRPAEVREAVRRVARDMGVAERMGYVPAEHRKFEPGPNTPAAVRDPEAARRVDEIARAFIDSMRGCDPIGPRIEWRRGQRPAFDRLRREGDSAAHRRPE